MDRLLEAMLSLAHKEKDIETNAKAKIVFAQFGSSSLNVSGVTNLEGSFVHPEEVPIHILVANDGTLNYSVGSTQHKSLTDEEEKYDTYFMP